MTTNFPTSVDSFPDPLATDRLDNPPHDVLHTNVNSAVEAIETALLDGAPLHIDDANERVGVGTTSPSTELEVDGTVTATEFVGDLQGPTHIRVKNTSGGSLSKGTPVYATGSVGASGAVEVQASLAGTASTMPALGLLDETLANNAQGSATILGVIRQMDTSSYSVNDSLYVAVSGGLTNVRPTGASELVQKIGRVVRSNASTGEVLVLGAGRSNDVPNGLSPTITLTGDASGSVTLTELSSGTLSVTVNDDSHSHSTYLPLTGGTVTGQTTFSATDGVKITGSSGGIWFDDRNGDGSKFVVYHSGAFLGFWNGSTTPFQFHDNGVGYATNWSVGTGSSANAFVGGSNYWRPQDAYGNSYFDINSGQFYVDSDTYYFRNRASTNSLVIDSSGNGTFTGTMSASRLQVGGHYIDDVAGSGNPYGSINVGGAMSWDGYAIDQRVVFMHDGGSYAGLYNDVNNQWMVYCTLNGGVELRYQGNNKLYVDTSGSVTNGRHYVTSNLDAAGMGNFSAHVETNQGIAVYGDDTQASINSTYLDHSSIQMPVDTYWGGCNTLHTGALIWSGGMCGWGTAQWGVRTSNNWGSYYSGSGVRVQGTRLYASLGVETALNVHSDGAGRLGYYSSRKELKNLVGYVEPSDSLSRIMALKPIDFTWKSETRPYYDPEDELIDFNVHRGFYAEDAAEVDRTYGAWGWLYKDDDHDGVGSLKMQPLTEELLNSGQTLEDAVVVSYNDKAIIADLVGAVQELQARIAQLEAT
jgi:hypothetical protein